MIDDSVGINQLKAVNSIAQKGIVWSPQHLVHPHHPHSQSRLAWAHRKHIASDSGWCGCKWLSANVRFKVCKHSLHLSVHAILTPVASGLQQCIYSVSGRSKAFIVNKATEIPSWLGIFSSNMGDMIKVSSTHTKHCF